MSSEINNSPSSSGQKKGLFSKPIIISLIFVSVLFVALGTSVYFYMKYQSTQAMLKNPVKDSEEEVKSIVAEVSKIIVLPDGEQPQVATVSDVNKLKAQPFFAQAKNGDKVLIYTKAQKAVLYDPIQKKVVEVGPINLTQVSPSVSPAPASLKVALYNGTSTTGLTSVIEKQLKQKMPEVTVIDKSNAGKATYEKTIVIDLSGKNTTGSAKLAKLLNGVVGALPSGELKPKEAEILVILGKQ